MKIETIDMRAIWNTLKTDSDTAALKELMDGCYQLMFGYGMRFSKDAEFVQDCIQEVFIAVWQHRKTLVVPDSPKAYLLTSLRRKMFSSGVKGTWISIDSLYDFDTEQETSLDSLVFGHEEVAFQVNLVRRLLSSLPERQREAIYLKFYQNLNRTEIAGIMNISEQSVSNMLQKALASLRKSCPAGYVFLSLLGALASCLTFVWQ